MNQRKWKGNTNYPLAQHVASHRNAYVSLVQCSEHVEHQLPNELTRVRKFIRSIECSDPKLLAAIAQVETDKSMQSNFEDMASFILPSDPVANNKASTSSKGGGLMSDTNANVSGVGGRDKTGLDLRFYKRKEFMKLSKTEKDSLTAWRSSNPDAFETSKRKALGNQGDNRKRQKSDHNNKSKGGRGLNDTQLAQIQSVMDKKVNALKDAPEKKVKFNEENTNASAWFKANMKKYAQENGDVSGLAAGYVSDRMQADINSAPASILRTINEYKASKSQKK